MGQVEVAAYFPGMQVMQEVAPGVLTEPAGQFTQVAGDVAVGSGLCFPAAQSMQVPFAK